MKEIYFITATNTDVGKTYACEQFLKKYSNNGKKVGYFKPIETGVIDKPRDGTKMLELTKKLNSSFDVNIEDVVPFCFKLPAAPFVANDSKEIDISLLLKKMHYLLNFCDVLIVEGAGGLMVPINKNFFMIDLIKTINPTQTYLITSSKLGSINDTLLSINMLKQYKLTFEWYINLYLDKETFEEVTLPFYKAYFDTIRFL